MSLRDVIAAGVATAKAAIIDLMESVTYYRASQATYNSSTGAVSSSTGSSLTAIVTDFKENERENEVYAPGDMWATILEPMAFVPAPGDYLTRAIGTWTVIGSYQPEPTASVTRLHIRRQ